MERGTKDEQVQNFTVGIDLQTHRRLKIQAVDERRPMSVIVREALRFYLDLYGATKPE